MGLELCQVWAIIFNLGHLWGTFATERAILFHVDNDTGLRNDLLALVPAGFSQKAQELLDGRSMYRLFYVLAAIRLGTFSHPHREILERALDMFPVGPIDSDAARYLWAFRRARQIAYCRMHSLLNQGIKIDPGAFSGLMSHLREYQEFGFDPQADADSAASALLDGIDGFHAESVFTNRLAAELVLGHLREFKAWWTSSATNSLSFGQRLSALWTKPVDWPTGTTKLPPHYLRLVLPELSAGWIAEVRDWRAKPETWAGADVLISPSPSSDRLTCDVYGERPLCQPAVHHIANLLSFRNASTWGSSDAGQKRLIWRAIARFGLQLLQDCVGQDVVVTMAPVAVRDGIGYAILSNNVETARSRLEEVLKRVEDEERRVELGAVLQYLNEYRPGGETPFVLTLLGTLEIVRSDERKAIAEIDGVIAFIHKKATEWFLLEHKGGARRRGGAGQLQRFRELFSMELSQPVWSDAAGGQIGIVHGNSTQRRSSANSGRA